MDNLAGGIYIIRYPKGYYVGQTINFDQRKKTHIRSLRKGDHHNKLLQEAYLVYGEGKMTWEFLECDIEHLTEMEQWFINNSDKSDLYNTLHRVSTPSRVYTFSATVDGYLSKLIERGRLLRVKAEERRRKVRDEKKLTNSSIIPKIKWDQCGDNNVSRRPEVRRKIAEHFRVFTEEQCIEVYDKHLLGKTQMELAAEYKVGRESVRTAIKHTEKYNLKRDKREK